MDSRTRDTHRRLHKQLREVGQPFGIDGKKALYPGAFGVPEEDIHCRCALLQRARWALSESELQQLRNTPEAKQLAQTENFAQFKNKYLELTENSAKPLTNSGGNGTIESEGVKPMIRAIEQPIEQQHTGKGNPNAILQFGTALNHRQASLLKMLPEFDSRAIVPKDAVNMADLSALTAFTGDEFAMFTLKGNRLILRGNVRSVNVDIETAKELAKQGYRWSGHTHPGMDFLCMQPSDGDYEILNQFHQENSVIYNSKGEFRTFERKGESDV